MSEQAELVRTLQLQEYYKANALQKLRRLPVETRANPTNSFVGRQLLAFPFIYGVNLERNATGFADVQNGDSIKNTKSDGLTLDVSKLVLTKMAEVFYGKLEPRHPFKSFLIHIKLRPCDRVVLRNQIKLFILLKKAVQSRTVRKTL